MTYNENNEDIPDIQFSFLNNMDPEQLAALRETSEHYVAAFNMDTDPGGFAKGLISFLGADRVHTALDNLDPMDPQLVEMLLLPFVGSLVHEIMLLTMIVPADKWRVAAIEDRATRAEGADPEMMEHKRFHDAGSKIFDLLADLHDSFMELESELEVIAAEDGIPEV